MAEDDQPKSSETETVTENFENFTRQTEISEKIQVENENFEDFEAAYSSDDNSLQQITKTQGKKSALKNHLILQKMEKQKPK